jgi:hypothetical protein
MKYVVKLEREIITRETCERTIEASSEQDAKDQAFRLACEADSCCPDDRQLDAADVSASSDWSYRVELA